MKKKNALKKISWVVYAVIVFEIIYMISPFAFFYYSAYGLPLNFLQKYEATSWLVDFFLPHYAYSDNAMINLHNMIGWPLLIIGLLFFIGGFCQIYYSKLFRKREVTGGLYNNIRHPQYVSLAVLGLGTLLVWPRFIILITFATMIFLYYFLARIEEKECVEKFGDSYIEYMLKTGMFFPRFNLFNKSSAQKKQILSAKGIPRLLSIIFLYVIVIAFTVLLGKKIRDYSISGIASYCNDSAFAISLTGLKKDEIKNIYDIVMNDSKVKSKIPSGVKYLIYVLPEEWHIPELPVSYKPEHVMPENYDRNLYKVLVASAITRKKPVSGNEIFKNATGFDPHVLAFVNVKEQSVGRIVNPPAAKWNGIAIPLF